MHPRRRSFAIHRRPRPRHRHPARRLRRRRLLEHGHHGGDERQRGRAAHVGAQTHPVECHHPRPVLRSSGEGAETPYLSEFPLQRASRRHVWITIPAFRRPRWGRTDQNVGKRRENSGHERRHIAGTKLQRTGYPGDSHIETGPELCWWWLSPRHPVAIRVFAFTSNDFAQTDRACEMSCVFTAEA